METKLTPKLQKKIIKYIEGGSYTVVACNAVGIDRQTLWQWIQKGERAIKLEKEGKKISKKQENYRNLNNGIKKARAEAEIRNIGIVQKAAKKSWPAAMTWLERKYPERWARRDKLEVKTKKTVISKQVIEVRQKIEKLSPGQRKQLITLAIKTEKEFNSNGNNGNNGNGR